MSTRELCSGNKRVAELGTVLCLLLAAGVASAQEADAQAADEVAAKLLAELKQAGEPLPEPFVLAPFRLPEGDAVAIRFYNHLRQALTTQGLKLIDRASVEAVLQEAGVTTGSIDETQAGALGAKGLITGSVDLAADGYFVNVRAIAVAEGKVVAVARHTFAGEAGALPNEARSLETQLRRLADRVAKGLDELKGDARYQTFAVLDFEEAGSSTQDKRLGVLVSSELTTFLRRDHGFIVLERGQLGQVIQEQVLSQSGVVDAGQAVEAGRLAGAQGLVMGTVSEAGDRYLVNARVVDSQTGTLVVSEDIQLPASDLVALSADAVVLRTKSGAVFRSVLIPGWGQFYNRETVKGVSFIGAEGLAVALAVTFHLLGSDTERRYKDLPNGTPVETFEIMRNDAEANYKLRNIFFFAALGVHLVNVLDAFISGETFEPASSVGVGGGGAVLTW